MSDRKRCPTTHKLGILPETSVNARKVIRSVCDRPEGHTSKTHRGRLLFGNDIVGLLEWEA